MKLRALLYTDYGAPRLLIPGALAVVFAFLFTLAFGAVAFRAKTDEERAEALYRTGKPAQAEAIYARLVRERPTVPLVIALLDAHEHARLRDKVGKALESLKKNKGGIDLPDDDPPLPDEEIEKIVGGLPPDVSVVARFWRAVAKHDVPEELRSEIETGAKREPPLPWANHMLALEAARTEKLDEAAGFFEKEGLSFKEREADIDHALLLLMSIDAWDRVSQKMQDPRIAAAASSSTKHRIAMHERDWKRAALTLPGVLEPRFSPNALMMTIVAAFGWMFFCARLGKVGARPGFRIPLYLAAFALGVFSVVPTLLLVILEEATLKLKESGDILRDLLFFVFGVGLREEASKLLLFLPLLPILRKWGDKLDVLVCAALVGLGFAAEENLQYLTHGDLGTGLGRFLTANFFHMSMTGIVASALDDFISDRERNAAAFTRATLMVVGLHGLYDFLIFHSELGGAYFAMGVFVVLTRMFLDAVDVARRRADRGITPLHAFIIAVGLVTGVSFAHAFATVGVKLGMLAVAGGLLGQAIIVYVFVKTLRTM